jgi:hypothetical protein
LHLKQHRYKNIRTPAGRANNHIFTAGYDVFQTSRDNWRRQFLDPASAVLMAVITESRQAQAKP